MTVEELKEVTKEKLKRECRDFIPMLNSLIKDIKNNDLKDESWFLDFLDEVNKISVSW